VNSNEVVVVAGCSRCGSSLMMEILEAGGLAPHCDNRTSYEAGDIMDAAIDGNGDILRRLSGKCVKVLDPKRLTLPDVPMAWIWLNRDPVQQAASQAKFMSALFGIPSPRGSSLADSVAKDNREGPEMLAARPTFRLLRVNFEELVTEPRRAVEAVAAFLEIPHTRLDRMVACVTVREPACAPDLAMELRRMERDSTGRRM
jgi:hypothetical protein